MPETAALAPWPPASLALAPRLFPERMDEAASWLDREAAGIVYSTLPHPLLLRSGRRRFLARVTREARDLEALDAPTLKTRARVAALASFAAREPAGLARALAHVREAARRTLGLAAHPPQVLGAWMLATGNFVELDTGEGKTLTAALAACLAALAGVPAHVVTVNDYLAGRDAEIMNPLFAFFGLSVGVVHSGVAQGLRAREYTRDITYCTNKDLVFDYLRDRVNARGVHSLAQLAVRRLHTERRAPEALRLRGLHFAIVDEADSILVDEARTPLILSSAREGGGDDAVYRELLEVAAGLEDDRDYRLAGPQRSVELSPRGRTLLEELAFARESDAEFWRVAWVREHYVSQALRALKVLRRDQHYVVAEGKIVIVDEFTGRLLPDRSWEQGLHQLVEAKEGCAVTGRNRTLARLTYQGFFARYLRLSGMSGTLKEISREMAAVYRLRTVRIEPNRPCRRRTLPTVLAADQDAKRAAVVAEVRARLADGQPVLVGTRSVHASIELSGALEAAGIPHRVLNALQNADEAALVASAGRPGAVTVATNMAGRGTDIPLDPAVVPHGGLHVVLTEWHESARIDRQLFGRCARQGDPGSCRAIVALDDEIVTSYAPGFARALAARYGARVPAWAGRLLRRVVQATAEAENAAQRRVTMWQDKQMRDQLAFSGSGE
ncbi:MAG: hypothetical protein HY943_19515 [Gammaproteobacteria bacterium]|nr:hypothetical protein [Gammaproteobacteria bacterium]